MAGVQIIDRDHGYKEFTRRLRRLGADVRVGVSSTPHDPDGTPCDEIAAAHEFGLGVPQRSFLRAWADDDAYVSSLNGVLDRALEEYIHERKSLPEALATVGKWMVESIRARMRGGLSPSLDQRTVERKRAEGETLTPLIATGQLENAITYETDVR
jgi:hypothetical protein